MYFRLFYTSLLALLYSIVAYSQNHMIAVDRFRDWGKEYLTITNGGYIRMEDGAIKSLKWIPEEGSLLPLPGLVITGINGKSTMGMGKEEFYEILDTHNTDSLCVLGVDSKIILTRIDNRSYGDYSGVVEIEHTNLASLLSGQKKAYDYTSVDDQYDRLGISYNELIDPDYDWAGKTFDYQLSGKDDLTDKTILDKLPLDTGFISRDTNDPDILFFINKWDNSIGYSIVFYAVDAKKTKMIGKEQQIWKLEINRTGGKPSQLIEEWTVLASWGPRKIPYLSHYRYYEGTYIRNNIEMSGTIVQWVRDGSDAAKAGLLVGDEIVSVEWILGRPKDVMTGVTTGPIKRNKYAKCKERFWQEPDRITIKKCKIKRNGQVISIHGPFPLAFSMGDFIMNAWE